MVLDAVGEDGKMVVFIRIGNLATLIFLLSVRSEQYHNSAKY